MMCARGSVAKDYSKLSFSKTGEASILSLIMIEFRLLGWAVSVGHTPIEYHALATVRK